MAICPSTWLLYLSDEITRVFSGSRCAQQTELPLWKYAGIVRSSHFFLGSDRKLILGHPHFICHLTRSCFGKESSLAFKLPFPRSNTTGCKKFWTPLWNSKPCRFESRKKEPQNAPNQFRTVWNIFKRSIYMSNFFCTFNFIIYCFLLRERSSEAPKFKNLFFCSFFS